MSRFYVGQRVKLARDCSIEIQGIEGVIVGFGFWPKGTLCATGLPLQFDSNVKVEWDKFPDGNRADHTRRLEPITDSYDKVEWSECLWRPQHEEQEA